MNKVAIVAAIKALDPNYAVSVAEPTATLLFHLNALKTLPTLPTNVSKRGVVRNGVAQWK